jgi:hypothetical protein
MFNRFAILIAAASTLAVPVAADAQRWRPIDQRQATQFQRIEQGVRSGALTRREATGLRSQFASLTRLERQYRRSNGLSVAERRDLDRRFDTLSRRIRVQKNDRQNRG